MLSSQVTLKEYNVNFPSKVLEWVSRPPDASGFNLTKQSTTENLSGSARSFRRRRHIYQSHFFVMRIYLTSSKTIVPVDPVVGAALTVTCIRASSNPKPVL